MEVVSQRDSLAVKEKRVIERERMSKDGVLWDDSVLITAFDDAMSKYKIMHSKKNHDGSNEGGHAITSSGEDVSPIVDGTSVATGYPESEENNNIASNAAMGESNELSSFQENHFVESSPIKTSTEISTGQPITGVQDSVRGNSYSQAEEAYSQLLSQYYELEDKRQKILQQLHQYGSGSYQYSAEGSGSGIQYGTCSIAEQNTYPTSHGSHPTVVCSCCPYYCPSTSVPTCSLGCSCLGSTCPVTCEATDQGDSLPLKDSDVVKKAMQASERAISLIKTNASVNSQVVEEKDKEENDGELKQSTDSETDLTTVLNAWYSAGFYTGKYLMEQSIERKRHG